MLISSSARSSNSSFVPKPLVLLLPLLLPLQLRVLSQVLMIRMPALFPVATAAIAIAAIFTSAQACRLCADHGEAAHSK